MNVKICRGKLEMSAKIERRKPTSHKHVTPTIGPPALRINATGNTARTPHGKIAAKMSVYFPSS